MGKGFAQGLSGGKRASRRLLSELVNGTRDNVAGAVRPARIYHKQIACAVKGQTLCAARHLTKRRSRIPMENSRRIVSVDVPAHIRHKQIAHAVEGQAGWAIGGIQRGKGSARSVRFVCIDAALIDVTDAAAVTRLLEPKKASVMVTVDASSAQSFWKAGSACKGSQHAVFIGMHR